MIRRNLYQVGGFVVRKFDSYWRVVKDEEKRRGCFTMEHEVVYLAQSKEDAFNWCNKH